MSWVDYDTHARTCPRDDLWGQVRRTVRGRAVDPAQIDLIVAAILDQLQPEPDDTLLDLACGNGALTARLQPHCRASLGVDVSPHLIGIAQERFARPQHGFLVDDASEFAELHAAPERFSTALCYGSLSYLSDPAVARLLRALHARFPNLRRVMLGNLPDPARAGAFYAGAVPDLREPRSDLGVWRTADELAHLAGPGWSLGTRVMPASFFASHYRFDALLARVR
jgi:cyclopropane fatty-acyl-phospholipid synthase-like methyltransferase